jgi:hypothetical protein
MKKLFVVMCSGLLMLGVGTSRSFAQAPDSFIQDIQVNENGSDIEGWNLTGTLPGNVAPSSSIDTPTGLGTITITYNPGAAGNYYIDTLIDEEVGTPFFNEYTSTSGTAPLGESWETGYISDATGTGPIYTDASSTTGDGLSGANNADGNTSSYPLNCTNNPSLGTVCNGDAVVALGEDFSLDATSYETITITVSDSAPASGFYIQQINPNDQGAGGEVSNVYFTETAVSTEECQGNACNVSPVPEPSPWILLATGLLGMGMIQLRKYSLEGGR